jgi:hypothetical protein
VKFYGILFLALACATCVALAVPLDISDWVLALTQDRAALVAAHARESQPNAETTLYRISSRPDLAREITFEIKTDSANYWILDFVTPKVTAAQVIGKADVDQILDSDRYQILNGKFIGCVFMNVKASVVGGRKYPAELRLYSHLTAQARGWVQ